MAETQTAEQTQSEQSEQSEQERGGNDSTAGHDTRKLAVRAAAIAAASGATALAAKKALSARGSKSDDDEGEGEREQRPAAKSGGGNSRGGNPQSMLTSVLSSSWESARGSLVPMLEDAAGNAGEYVGRNAPELVTDKIVPQFIRGFERGRQDGGSSGEDDEE